MTRRDEGKTTLVDFLRSIKFSHAQTHTGEGSTSTPFASLSSSTRQPERQVDDVQHIRSAN
ncbi:MAG: hypothetical protein ABJ084_14890 [Halioglobus sp.]